MTNPTSNYGWVLPNSADLVTDLPADFDVALQGVDTRLKALQPGTTLGDLAYSSATANTNTRLGVGSNGQFLTVTGGVPAWATVAGGGKLLQVVSATTSTVTIINTTTLTDTGLTATITPTSATSKILVIISSMCVHFRNSGASSVGAKVLRGSTSIGDFGGDGWSAIFATATAGSALSGAVVNNAFNYLDSPATTSATTYKLQGRLETTASGSTSEWNSSRPSTITLMEIGA